MTYYSGTFQYTQPTADYNASDSPFVNTDGSFTTLTKTTSGSDTIVSWTLDDFNSIPMSIHRSLFKNYTGSFPSTVLIFLLYYPHI